jgi:putative tricarboxylic transport membrane protein
VEREQEQVKHYLKLAGIIADDAARMSAGRLAFLGGGLLAAALALLLLLRRIRQKPLSGSLAIAVFTAAAVVFLFRITGEFPVGKLSAGVGPASAPRMWLSLTLLLSLLLAFREWHRKDIRPRDGQPLRVVYFILLLASYIYLLPRVGYLLLTPVFLLAGIYPLGHRRHLTIWMVTLGFTFLAWGAFQKILHVPLPTGVWP